MTGFEKLQALIRNKISVNIQILCPRSVVKNDFEVVRVVAFYMDANDCITDITSYGPSIESSFNDTVNRLYNIAKQEYPERFK